MSSWNTADRIIEGRVDPKTLSRAELMAALVGWCHTNASTTEAPAFERWRLLPFWRHRPNPQQAADWGFKNNEFDKLMAQYGAPRADDPQQLDNLALRIPAVLRSAVVQQFADRPGDTKFFRWLMSVHQLEQYGQLDQPRPLKMFKY